MEPSTQEGPKGDVVVIEAPKRLDASTVPAFKEKINEVVEQGKYKLVINLGNTEFMDSSGLGALVSRIAESRSNQGDIRLATLTDRVLELLEITQLNKVLKLYDELDAAIESYS